MSNFTFLHPEWISIHEAATKAESLAHSDPRTSCFYGRRALELLIAWLFKHDSNLKLPYQDNLSALIHEPTFKVLVGEGIFSKTRVITKLGNQAVHSHRTVMSSDSLTSIRELFHVSYWLAHNYARGIKPSPELAFNQDLVPKTSPLTKQTIDQLKTLETQLHEKDEKLTELLADKETLNAELQRLREEILQVKRQNESTKDTHDYSEEQTRDYFIDLLLKEAGWALDQKRDREYEVSGMPNNKGVGYVDYVLWGDDGKPLGLVEAKRTRRDPRVGQRQAELYADCLEKQFGQRPIIFYSNGYTHWMWDNLNYPPREVQGFYKKQELELLIQRRSTRKKLKSEKINNEIAGGRYYYQERAIRKITEAFENDNDRKALLVMATGSGKTRTVIALYDLLARCNWAKRVLFLADRVALVNQAGNAFLKHLPDSSPVNLVKTPEGEGRVYVSTYPTMMGLINDTKDELRRFGPGHFDLIIIDEAHRSIFQKYKAIFSYFDSFLVGLTATPRSEIDRNTYSLFDLENDVPTDVYELSEAVRDKFLVPPKAISVPIRFIREGIKYNQLSEDEKEQWEETDWDDSGEIPDEINAGAINQWLFNKDTVDKVLENLMTKGLKVAGGDRLGKTIIFAKNQKHADFIQERFNANYPKYRGEFARVITFNTEYAQSLIDTFSNKDKSPHIAISVDMLDTGIDVPEVVNLVFFKMVRSRTKFWQMLGRGTRLCPDLFGPGLDKKNFFIFDYLQNLEYFSENPEGSEGSITKPLSQRIFDARLDLINELAAADTGKELSKETSNILRNEVASMNLDNFVVRPKRKYVEKYAKENTWEQLKIEDIEAMKQHVSSLPTEIESDAEEAKRFDLLMLRTQLAVLQNGSDLSRLSEQIRKIASLLEEKATIPMVAAELTLIQEIQSSEWWQDITVYLLESARKKLRLLIQFIEKKERRIIYTDFEDELGEDIEITLPIFDTATSTPFTEAGNLENFRLKAKAFLNQHQNHITIRKLRMNAQLTKSDISELEKIFIENGIADNSTLEKAKAESHGLGLFVRSLVGLDREAAKNAFSSFMRSFTLTANQITFVNMIIEHLTEHGIMDASLLYESPFTDINPLGPEGIFNSEQVNEIIKLLDEVRVHAMVA